MNTRYLSLIAVASTTLLVACGGDDPVTEPAPTDSVPAQVETPVEPAPDEPFMGTAQDANGNTITVSEAEIAAEYDDAMIDLLSPDDLGVGENSFEFELMNYELASETPGWEGRDCANSGKGQHIHWIHNNQPYKAHYESAFVENIEEEGDHVILAFISRSYHESIKHEGAYVLKGYHIGEGESTFDRHGAHLFYSRPKGTYTLAESKRFLLDFYLVNVDMKETGYMVRATIDGAEFMLPHWKPYFIEGLAAGEHTVRIELVDHKGVPVPGPFNDSGDRTFTVTEA